MFLSAHPLDKYAYEMENFTDTTLEMLPDIVNKCTEEQKPKNVTVGCIVLSVSQRASKTGRPYLETTVEDFTGPYSFRLFGKDFEAFGSRFKEGEALLLDGKVDTRFFFRPDPEKPNEKAEYEFKVKGVSHLGNAAESFIKDLILEVFLDQINPDFEKRLISVLRANKGKTPVIMRVKNPKRKATADFLIKKYAVAVSTDLIETLRMLGIKCEVNKK